MIAQDIDQFFDDDLDIDIDREDLENHIEQLQETEAYYEKYQTNQKQCIKYIKCGRYKKAINLIKKIFNDNDIPLFGILKFNRYFIYTCIKLSQKAISKNHIKPKRVQLLMCSLKQGLSKFEEMINLLITLTEYKQEYQISNHTKKYQDLELYSKSSLGLDLNDHKRVDQLINFYSEDLLIFSTQSIIIGYFYNKYQKQQAEALTMSKQLIKLYKTHLRGNIIEHEYLNKLVGQIFIIQGNILIENQNFEEAIKNYNKSLQYLQKALQLSFQWFASKDTANISVKREIQCERIVQNIVINLYNQSIAYENLSDYCKTLECVGLMEFFTERLLLYESSIQIKYLVRNTKEKLNEKYKAQLIEIGEINHLLKLIYPEVEKEAFISHNQINESEVWLNYWDRYLYYLFNYKQTNENLIIVQKQKNYDQNNQKNKSQTRKYRGSIRLQSQYILSTDQQQQSIINHKNSIKQLNIIQKSSQESVVQSKKQAVEEKQKDYFLSPQTSFSSHHRIHSTLDQSVNMPIKSLKHSIAEYNSDKTKSFHSTNMNNHRNNQSMFSKGIMSQASSSNLNNKEYKQNNFNRPNKSKSIADFFMSKQIDEAYSPKILLQDNYFGKKNSNNNNKNNNNIVNNNSQADNPEKSSLYFQDQQFWHLKLDKNRDFSQSARKGGTCLDVYFREQDFWCDDDVLRLDREMKSMIDEKLIQEDSTYSKVLSEKYGNKYYDFLNKMKQNLDDQKDYEIGKSYLNFKKNFSAFYTIKPKTKSQMEVEEESNFNKIKEIENNEKSFKQQYIQQIFNQNQISKSESAAIQPLQFNTAKSNIEQRQKSLKSMILNHSKSFKVDNVIQQIKKQKLEFQNSNSATKIQKFKEQTSPDQQDQQSKVTFNNNVHHFITSPNSNSQNQQHQQNQQQIQTTQAPFKKLQVSKSATSAKQNKEELIKQQAELKQKLLNKQIAQNYEKNQNVVKKFILLNETERQQLEQQLIEKQQQKNPTKSVNKYFNGAYISQFNQLSQNMKNLHLKARAERGLLNMGDILALSKLSSNIDIKKEKQQKQILTQKSSKRHIIALNQSNNN